MDEDEAPADSAQVVRDASFTSAIDLYLNANPWVNDDHTPYVTALFQIAKQLDYSKFSAAAVMEYRQNFKELRACQPASVAPAGAQSGAGVDPFDAALAKIVAGESAGGSPREVWQQ
ncbi:hypothetical protein [Prescottella equi]